MALSNKKWNVPKNFRSVTSDLNYGKDCHRDMGDPTKAQVKSVGLNILCTRHKPTTGFYNNQVMELSTLIRNLSGVFYIPDYKILPCLHYLITRRGLYAFSIAPFSRIM